MAKQLEQLQKRLGYKFKEVALLRLALTHPSVAHEASDGIPHNQRLEFLGDSVLGLVLTSELYARFPDVSEGPLTKAEVTSVHDRAATGSR